MSKKYNAWDWEEIGRPLVDHCEHCSGIVLFSLYRFSLVKCTWWCRGWLFQWKHFDGTTRIFWKVKA